MRWRDNTNHLMTTSHRVPFGTIKAYKEDLCVNIEKKLGVYLQVFIGGDKRGQYVDSQGAWAI